MRMPLSGERYRDDNGNIHNIIEITSMFFKPCIKYIADGNNCYIDLVALHLHSSETFWFKEPLTDSI